MSKFRPDRYDLAVMEIARLRDRLAAAKLHGKAGWDKALRMADEQESRIAACFVDLRDENTRLTDEIARLREELLPEQERDAMDRYAAERDAAEGQ